VHEGYRTGISGSRSSGHTRSVTGGRLQGDTCKCTLSTLARPATHARGSTSTRIHTNVTTNLTAPLRCANPKPRDPHPHPTPHTHPTPHNTATAAHLVEVPVLDEEEGEGGPRQVRRHGLGQLAGKHGKAQVQEQLAPVNLACPQRRQGSSGEGQCANTDCFRQPNAQGLRLQCGYGRNDGDAVTGPTNTHNKAAALGVGLHTRGHPPSPSSRNRLSTSSTSSLWEPCAGWDSPPCNGSHRDEPTAPTNTPTLRWTSAPPQSKDSWGRRKN
jgi:hypothetical protein